jgi:hypothetical protein
MNLLSSNLNVKTLIYLFYHIKKLTTISEFHMPEKDLYKQHQEISLYIRQIIRNTGSELLRDVTLIEKVDKKLVS